MNFYNFKTYSSKTRPKFFRYADLEKVNDFVYLGAWIATTERDLRVRKAKAWAACHKLRKIWKSGLRRRMKIRLFVVKVESILLYGSETWTLTESLKKQIDGCYTGMLRMALNVDWKQHKTLVAKSRESGN